MTENRQNFDIRILNKDSKNFNISSELEELQQIEIDDCKKLLAKMEKIDLNNIYNRRLLEKMLNLGLNDEVVEALEKIEITSTDLLDEKMFNFLNELLDSGQYQVVKKITDNIMAKTDFANINLDDKKTNTLLENLTIWGQEDAVMNIISKIDTKNINLNSKYTCEILASLAKQNKAGEVLDIINKLNIKQFDLVNYYPIYFLFLSLIRSGQAEKIINIIGKTDIKKIVLSDHNTYGIFSSLLNFGQADKLMDIILKVNIKDIDLDSHRTYDILFKLANSGQMEKIKKITDKIIAKIKISEINLFDNDTYKLLERLKNLGQAEKIKNDTANILDEINPNEIDFKKQYNCIFFHRLANLGHDKKIIDILIQIDINNFDLEDQDIYNLLLQLAKLGHEKEIKKITDKIIAKINLDNFDPMDENTFLILLKLHDLNQAEKIKITIDKILTNLNTNKIDLEDYKITITLDRLKKINKTDEVEQLIEKNIAPIKPEIVTTETNELKDNLIEDCVKRRYHPPKNIETFLHSLSIPELHFLQMILNKYDNYLHPEVIQLIKGLEKGEPFVVQIQKTGSDLFVLGGSKDTHTGDDKTRPIAFMHRITTYASEAWKKSIEANIPSAPITGEILDYGEKSDTVVIPSRYCGLSLGQYNNMFRENDKFKPFLFLLENKYDDIKTKLEDNDIRHGHTHSGNATVEFVKKDWLNQQLQAGKNINNLPFDQNNISFDPVEYFKNPSNWEVVVRVIDFDQATSSPK